MSEKWKVGGTYFEACNCKAPCPCNFLGAPSEGECTVVIAWHIEQGQHGDVDLGGLNAALFAYAPGHMMETKWRVALYLDDRANPQQAEALGKIFSGQDGGHLAALAPLIGEVMGVQAAQIEYRAEGRQRSVKIGSVAEVSVEAMEGQGGQLVEVHNVPFTAVPDVPLVAARSTALRYGDHGFSVDISGRNGYYSPFTYQA
jgi:hypothetical protein